MKNQYKINIHFAYRVGCIMILIIFLTNVRAQEPIILTWTDAINRALNQNPNLASAEANLEASEQNIKIAQGKYLPGFNVTGSISQSKSATFSETAGVVPASSAIVGASISQMVYNEKYLANHKIQKYLYASQEEQFRNTSYATISTAGQAYIGLLFADDLLDVQQQNMKITEQNLQAARDRLEVGSTNRQEVLRWETQMYANQQAVESQKAAVMVSRGGLNQLLNLPIETIEVLEKLSVEKDGFIFSSDLVAGSVNDANKARLVRDYLVELGLANSPALASFDQQLLAQNRQLQSDKRYAIPRLNASAGANAKFGFEDESVDQLDNDKGFWKFGLTMYVPLVSGGANYSKITQSKLQMSALEQQKYNITTSLEQSIRATASIVISDFINIGFADEQAKTAQLNYDLVYDAYLLGESSLLDLLDAQTQKLSADISSRIALYTFFVDMLSLNQAIGYFPVLETQEEHYKIMAELESQLFNQ